MDDAAKRRGGNAEDEKRRGVYYRTIRDWNRSGRTMRRSLFALFKHPATAALTKFNSLMWERLARSVLHQRNRHCNDVYRESTADNVILPHVRQ